MNKVKGAKASKPGVVSRLDELENTVKFSLSYLELQRFVNAFLLEQAVDFAPTVKASDVTVLVRLDNTLSLVESGSKVYVAKVEKEEENGDTTSEPQPDMGTVIEEAPLA